MALSANQERLDWPAQLEDITKASLGRVNAEKIGVTIFIIPSDLVKSLPQPLD